MQSAADSAYADWERRSRLEWTSDYSWVTRKHGFAIGADAESLAQAANRDLVTQAAQRVPDDWYHDHGTSNIYIWLQADASFPQHSAESSHEKPSWIASMKRWFGTK